MIRRHRAMCIVTQSQDLDVCSAAVFDPDAPYTKRVLEELGKGMVRHRLIKVGRWLLQSNNDTDGEDLLQEALILVCDPDKKPWDQAHSFFGHVTWVMKYLNIDERRLVRSMNEVVDSNLARDDVIVDPAPAPDDALSAHRELDRLRRLGQRLTDRLDPDDRHAREVLLYGAQDIESAAELADKIGCSPQDIQNAQRRIARLARDILEEERKDEAKRMHELREKANLAKKAPGGKGEGTP